jgi:ribonuclease HII
MSTTSTGNQAEAAVAEYLRTQGYMIIEQNWKTKRCEIDVVAQKNDTVYFVEVKYRKSNYQGDGLAYITDKKLGQMSFAAELWVSSHSWQGGYELLGAAVTGKDFTVTDVIEL